MPPKPHRTLRLSSPFMRGADIAAVQRALRIDPDGDYGPDTAAAVKAWKWRAGYTRAAINDGLGIRGQGWLLGLERLPVDMLERAQRRKRRGYEPGAGIAIKTPVEIRDDAIEEMRRWARKGLVEQPAGSNVQPFLVDLAEAEDVSDAIDEMGYPWCAFAMMLANLRAGGQTGEASLVHRAFNGLYCPEIVRFAGLHRYGMELIDRADARRGDWVLFDFGLGLPQHIGAIDDDRVLSGVPFVTLEGNTSADNGGSQDNGGGFYRRTERTTATAKWFVRSS
jgi:hypothetical protein